MSERFSAWRVISSPAFSWPMPSTPARIWPKTECIVMPAENLADFEAQYRALTQGSGLVDLSDRTQVEFTGSDRATFLHNLCTNQIRELPAGSGCEAFVLNVKGHVVGHVFLFATPQSHVLETVAGQSATLMAHFDRYLIREDVQLHDRSTEWAELLVAGPQAEGLIASRGLLIRSDRLAHAAGELAGASVWVRRVDLAGPAGFLVACARDSLAAVQRWAIGAGAVPCAAHAFETARIEYGMPVFGRDITEESLPQEVDRNRAAISFTKGCYLGQETIARIDALGHVNRLLRGVKFSGQAIPAAGTELLSKADGRMVGQVSSSCWSPRFGAPLALGLVRRGYHEPGGLLGSACGDAEIVTLPT